MAATGVPFERGEDRCRTGRQRGGRQDHGAGDPDDGRLGLRQGHRVEKWYRDAELTIFEGTSEIERIVI